MRLTKQGAKGIYGREIEDFKQELLERLGYMVHADFEKYDHWVWACEDEVSRKVYQEEAAAWRAAWHNATCKTRRVLGISDAEWDALECDSKLAAIEKAATA